MSQQSERHKQIIVQNHTYFKIGGFEKTSYKRDLSLKYTQKLLNEIRKFSASPVMTKQNNPFTDHSVHHN